MHKGQVLKADSSDRIELGLRALIEIRAAEYARKHFLQRIRGLDEKLSLLISKVDGFTLSRDADLELVSREDARFILGVDRSTLIARENAARLPRPDHKVGRQKAYLRSEFDRMISDLPDTTGARLYSRLHLYRSTGWSIATIHDLETSGRLPRATKVKDGAPWAYRRADLEPTAKMLGIELSRGAA